MSKRKKNTCDCREDRRTQREKELDANLEKHIHTYPLRHDAWKAFEPYNRMNVAENK